MLRRRSRSCWTTRSAPPSSSAGQPVLANLKAVARRAIAQANATDRLWLVTADGRVQGGGPATISGGDRRNAAIGGRGNLPRAVARGAALARSSGVTDPVVADRDRWSGYRVAGCDRSRMACESWSMHPARALPAIGPSRPRRHGPCAGRPMARSPRPLPDMYSPGATTRRHTGLRSARARWRAAQWPSPTGDTASAAGGDLSAGGTARTRLGGGHRRARAR